MAALAQSGCISMDSLKHEFRPSGMPSSIAAVWIHEVLTAMDPVHGGEPLPGIAGRIHFFTDKVDSSILPPDGKIVVAIYDDAPSLHGEDSTKSRPVVTCTYEKDILKQFGRKDPVGWGYSLFVPWPEYDPKITCVLIKMWYERPGTCRSMPIWIASSWAIPS